MAGSNQDIDDSKQAHATLLAISQGTAAASGEAFFRCLVQHMAEAFRVDFAFVSEVVDAGMKRARLISFWDGDGHGETFEYDTVDTPCEQVLVEKRAVHHATQVWKLFPKLGHSIMGKILDQYVEKEEPTLYGLLNAGTNIFWHNRKMTASDFNNNDQFVSGLLEYAFEHLN